MFLFFSQAVETRHALHGVTWPVSNPKTLQVDFSTQEAFDKAKANEDTENTQTSTIPGTVEDWLREQDAKRERGELVRFLTSFFFIVSSQYSHVAFRKILWGGVTRNSSCLYQRGVGRDQDFQEWVC